MQSDQGPPWEGYSDQEVLDRYGSVAHNVPQTDYEQAAREALARLSPGQRAEFAQELQTAFVPFAEGCWHDIESDGGAYQGRVLYFDISVLRRPHHVVNMRSRYCYFILDELFGITHQTWQKA